MKKCYLTLLTLIGSFAYAQTPEIPQLNAPENGTMINGITTSLDWIDSDGESGYIYQIDNTATFNSPRLITLTLNTFSGPGNPTVNLSNLSFGTTYYWRVATQNGSSQSAWSQIRNFSTIAYPELSSPDNGEEIHSVLAQLRWNDVDGETGYRYEYDVVDTFDSPSLVTGTIDAHESGNSRPFVTADNLSQNVIYYWRVAILNGTSQSEWSPIWTFSTDNPAAGTDDFANTRFTVYPNPATDVLNVENITTNSSYAITSLEGRRVLSGYVDATAQLNVSNLPTGLYMITIENESQKEVRKFVKQ